MMACAAAIAEVHRMLPAAHSRGHPGYELAPITARAAFKRINWWTLATIEEAFVALVRTGVSRDDAYPSQRRGRISSGSRASEGPKMSRVSENLNSEVYGVMPGYKSEGTSRDAAGAMKREAANLRALVLAILEQYGARGLTADEAAANLNMSPLAIRPRFTELGPKHFNKIERTGERRWNLSGLKATVWRVRK
jgi:hypothetical protein